MRHPHHDFLHADTAGLVDQPVQHRDHGVATFARKSLLADVFGMKISLQRFSRRQALEDVPAQLRRIRRARANRLQSLLEEALGRGVGDVHVFGAERARIGFLQRLHDIPQTHPGRASLVGPNIEHGVHVGFGEAVSLEVEVGDVGRRVLMQWVEVSIEHAERAELADEAQDQHLLVHGGGVDHCAVHSPIARHLAERLDHRRMRHVGRVTAQLVEITTPFGGYRRRVGQVALIELLDEGRVGTEQRTSRFQFFHQTHCIISRRAGAAAAATQPDAIYLRCASGTTVRRGAPT